MDRTSLLRRPFAYANLNLTLWLIAINIAVYGLGLFVPSLDYALAMIPVFVLHGWLWQLFTYMFVHGGLWHLFFNMFGLFIFGTQVERELGSREFLLYYLLTGFLSGLFSFVAYTAAGAMMVPLVGASGAIFAVLLAYAVLNPNADIYLFGILPIRAPILVVVYAVVELVDQFAGLESSVAHLTHLAGFGFGWLYFIVRLGVHPARQLFPKRKR
jgi:membrane associated rhomboid family serine protease